MAAERIRIPLQESVTRDDLDRAAWNNRWHFDRVIEQTEDVPHEVVWVANDKTVIHYIEDFLIEVSYLLIEGPGAAEVAEQAHASLKTYRPEDILKMAREAKGRDEVGRAVYYAAVAAPARFDQKFFDIFEDALAHEDPDVRGAVVVAAGYAGWPKFRPVLERLRQSDPDAEVRDAAGKMLESLAPDWGRKPGG